MARQNRTPPTDTQIALFQTVESPEPFRKAVQAIHIAPRSGIISLQQRKMFNSLIKNAISQNEENEGRTLFEMTAGSLSNDIGLNSNNSQYVKDTLNSLISTVVNWDFLTPDKRNIWKSSGLLAGAEIEGPKLRYSFSDQIRTELLNPEIYALIDMRITRQFRRAHSLALWENTVRYEAIGITAKFPLQTFRELILGLDNGTQSYAEYKAFKSKVIVPCVREVNEISDHLLELVEHKNGRSVVAIQFKVNRKAEAKLDVNEKEIALLDEVAKLQVPRSEAAKLIAEYGEDRVNSAIEYTRARKAKKNAPSLDNEAAYFRKALQSGWQAPTAKTADPAKPQPRKKVTTSDVRARYIASEIPRSREYFNELSIDDQAVLIDRYNGTVDTKNLKIIAGKRSTKLAETSFFSWLVIDTWGDPSAEDLLSFVVNGGAAIDAAA